MKYRVIEDYRSPYPESLIFHKGDHVIIRQEYQENPNWSDWVWCDGSNGVQAWTPKSYLNIHGENGVLQRNYNARELSVTEGEEIEISEIVGGFGMAVKGDGDTGWVPMNVLEKC